MAAFGGFLGSGGSESSSKTSNTNTTQQPVASDRSSANALDLSLTKTKNVTANVEFTDFGAIQAGIDASDRATENALTFGAGAVEVASQSLEDALSFGAGSLEIATRSIDSTVGQLFDTVQAQSVLQAQRDVDLLEFSAGAIEQNRAANQDALSLVDNAVAATQVSTDNAINNALTFGAGSIESAFSFVGDTLTNVIGLATSNTAALAESQSETITAIGESTRSDSAENFKNLIYLAGTAFVAIAGLAYFARR